MITSWKRGFAVAKAAREHSNAPHPCKKVGAALFSGPNLLSIGFNTYGRQHPECHLESNSIHAEHAAIIKRRYFEDNSLTLYVYREAIIDGAVIPAISQPCQNCMKIIQFIDIKRVRFFDIEGNPQEIKL